MTDAIRRPAAGYAIELYHALIRTVRDLPRDIADSERIAARHLARATRLRQQLAEAEGTLAWMRAHQADEIAALEAHRWRVMTALRAARWVQEGTV